MARTIAISERVYAKLRELKELLGVGYSELIEMLIETYEKYRRESLEKMLNESRMRNEDVEKVRKTVAELRGRSWW